METCLSSRVSSRVSHVPSATRPRSSLATGAGQRRGSARPARSLGCVSETAFFSKIALRLPVHRPPCPISGQRARRRRLAPGAGRRAAVASAPVGSALSLRPHCTHTSYIIIALHHSLALRLTAAPGTAQLRSLYPTRHASFHGPSSCMPRPRPMCMPRLRAATHPPTKRGVQPQPTPLETPRHRPPYPARHIAFPTMRTVPCASGLMDNPSVTSLGEADASATLQSQTSDALIVELVDRLAVRARDHARARGHTKRPPAGVANGAHDARRQRRRLPDDWCRLDLHPTRRGGCGCFRLLIVERDALCRLGVGLHRGLAERETSHAPSERREARPR